MITGGWKEKELRQQLAEAKDALIVAMRERNDAYDLVSKADAALTVAAKERQELVSALRRSEEWLSGWASAEPYLSDVRAAIKKAT